MARANHKSNLAHRNSLLFETKEVPKTGLFSYEKENKDWERLVDAIEEKQKRKIFEWIQLQNSKSANLTAVDGVDKTYGLPMKPRYPSVSSSQRLGRISENLRSVARGDSDNSWIHKLIDDAKKQIKDLPNNYVASKEDEDPPTETYTISKGYEELEKLNSKFKGLKLKAPGQTPKWSTKKFPGPIQEKQEMINAYKSIEKIFKEARMSREKELEELIKAHQEMQPKRGIIKSGTRADLPQGKPPRRVQFHEDLAMKNKRLNKTKFSKSIEWKPINKMMGREILMSKPAKHGQFRSETTVKDRCEDPGRAVFGVSMGRGSTKSHIVAENSPQLVLSDYYYKKQAPANRTQSATNQHVVRSSAKAKKVPWR